MVHCRWADNIAIMGQFSVILIDEVHTVGEERGASLEAVTLPLVLPAIVAACVSSKPVSFSFVRLVVPGRQSHGNVRVTNARPMQLSGTLLLCVPTSQKAVTLHPVVIERKWPALRSRVVAVSATLPNLGDIAA